MVGFIVIMERIIMNLRVLLLESQGSTNECQAESLKGISENCKKKKKKRKEKENKETTTVFCVIIWMS